jgi:hypothetical protein
MHREPPKTDCGPRPAAAPPRPHFLSKETIIEGSMERHSILDISEIGYWVLVGQLSKEG